jgi:hypothetical protein
MAVESALTRPSAKPSMSQLREKEREEEGMKGVNGDV